MFIFAVLIERHDRCGGVIVKLTAAVSAFGARFNLLRGEIRQKALEHVLGTADIVESEHVV